MEKAISTPVIRQKGDKWFYDGKMRTAKELAEIHGNLSAASMRDRLRNGMSPEQAVLEPKSNGKRITPKIVTEIKRVKRKGWQPAKSPEDIRKCKRCRYSEKIGSELCCMYAVLHSPPERRGCEPGKNCTKYEGKSKESEKIKLGEWAKAVKAYE